MIPTLIKAYGAFHPVGKDCLLAVRHAGSAAIASSDMPEISPGENCPWLRLEDGLLRISFEGLCFPAEDVLAALAATLPGHAEGKLDILDMEAWTLTRHQWTHEGFQTSGRGLNEVLDYSGY